MARQREEGKMGSGKDVERRPTCHMAWVVLAGVFGLITSALLAGVLEMERVWFLAIYAPLALLLVFTYFRWSGADVVELFKRNWKWGLIGGALIGLFSVNSVLMQSGSDMPEGAELVLDLVWLGLVYGIVDALLLSVLPVFAVQKAMEGKGYATTRKGLMISGALAVLASMAVIGLYHIGYPEFRDAEVIVIMLGVGLQSLAYVVTKSPLAPVVSHVAMHVAAVLYGIDSVIQLPPHY